MPDLGGQFVCSFKSNSKHTLLYLYGHNIPIFLFFEVISLDAILLSTIAASCKYYRCAL